MPTDHNTGVNIDEGVQYTVKKNELYGRQALNQRWLQDRKLSNGIDVHEQALAAGSKKSNLNNFLLYVQAWQTNGVGLTLWKFYSERSVQHKSWDTRISMDSALDGAADRLLNMIRGRPRERQQAPGPPATPEQRAERRRTKKGQQRDWNRQRWQSDRPVLLAFGMDALTSGSDHRKGSRPALDGKLARRIVLRTKGKQGRRFVPVRIDEYGTSKFCPRCAMAGAETELQFLHRAPPLYRQLDQDRLNELGQEQVIRIRVCPTCQHTFHRDGAAGQNLASIALSMLQHGQRPSQYIFPSRRLPNKQNNSAIQDRMIRFYTRILVW